jgi:hypothetical protein
MWSPSSSTSSPIYGLSSSKLSSESGARSGMSSMSTSIDGSRPVQHVQIHSASLNAVFHSAFVLFWQVQQWFRQQLILISFICQSTLGLCSQSQLSPRMMFCLPKQINTNIACLEWLWY